MWKDQPLKRKQGDVAENEEEDEAEVVEQGLSRFHDWFKRGYWVNLDGPFQMAPSTVLTHLNVFAEDVFDAAAEIVHGMEEVNAVHERPKRLKTSGTFEPQNNGCDCISQLHDDMLILILDKLPMVDAVPTCILAKRWRYLWRYKTRVDFDGNWAKRTGKYVFNAAQQFMYYHQSPQIERFSLSFRYASYMRDSVNSWIMSAFIKGVKEICIDLNCAEKKRKMRKLSDFRLLPDCKIECGTLVKLKLKFMELDMRVTSLPALEELYLEEVEVGANVVEMFTVDCSSLKLISLTNCNTKSDLKISAKSKSFKLIINEELGKVGRNTSLYIDVPNVISIEFASALPRKKYQVGDVSLANIVKFSLDQMSQSRGAVKVGQSGLLGVQFRSNFLHLFGVFKTANVLSLSSWCIQILGLEVIFNSRQLSKPSAVSHVILEMGLTTVELIGLVYMLRVCKGLKRISIIITKPEDFHFTESLNRTYLNCSKYAMLDFKGNELKYTDTEDLPNLEVLEFHNDSANFEFDMWTNGSFCFDEARFFKGTESGFTTLSLLKSRAKNLRKIVFTSRKCRCETDLSCGTYSFSARTS